MDSKFDKFVTVVPVDHVILVGRLRRSFRLTLILVSSLVYTSGTRFGIEPRLSPWRSHLLLDLSRLQRMTLIRQNLPSPSGRLSISCGVKLKERYWESR